MKQFQQFLTKVYRGVGTTRAKRMQMLLDAGEWALLQRESLSNPSVYQNHIMYLKDALVVELTRKLLLPGDSEKRRNKAVETFFSSEAECFRTNARLSRFVNNGPFRDQADIRVADFINRWRKEIARVLGPCSEWLDPRFSGGSTLSDAGKLTTIPDKMSSRPTTYAGSTKFRHCFEFTPLDCEDPELVRANRFFTVPKDSFKDRGCCVEASWPISLQLAVGARLKDRYRRAYKVDLKRAPDLHRELAQAASEGILDLATIDLSNASDTVARDLVRLLLPRKWYELLNSLRAHQTSLDGKVYFLNKFSSMGNGFTFELETIIFKTLCVALGSKSSWVFGDDIIVETELSKDVIPALRFFGFTPNEKKTFCEGPFRESCGGDYFNGKPVRAHYIKELPDEPQKWIALANGIRRADSLGLLSAAWRFCIDQLPSDWRNYGPEWLGDTVIHCESASPSIRRSRHKECTVDGNVTIVSDPIPMWRVKRPVGRTWDLGKHWSYRVATAAASLGVPNRVATRDDITGYKTDYIIAYGIQTESQDGIQALARPQLPSA